MGASTRLAVRALAKRFGRHVVLDGVDLEVRAGELVALVGENGAGKTTLVQCIAGTLAPDAGEIELDGGRPPAVVWQDLALCENLDVTANLFLGREPGRFWLTESGLDRRARRLLDELGIQLPDLGRPVSFLSGGQRQQLAIARALVDRPELLILDEPTASLGVLETRNVERMLLDLRASGCALLLISHRIEQLFGLADRVVVLRHGRVVADRPTTELHPDDIVSLMAGLDADSTARRQMERLRSLVDQLAEVEPSASIPLIVSALSTAVGADKICVHLTVPGRDAAQPLRLRRRAAVGVGAPLLARNEELPLGAAGGLVGLAAELRSVVVTEDVRRHPAWDDHRDAGIAAGVLSAWAMPIESADGVLGVISVYADAVGRPQPAVLELAAMYTNLAVAAIEREWLLGEVMRRNQILESLRGMLDRLTGPEPDEGDLAPALSALCAVLGASAVVVCTVEGGTVTVGTSTDRQARPAAPDVEAACAAAVTAPDDHVLAIPLAVPDRRVVLTAWWSDPARRGVDAADLLADAARSLSLAIEREGVAAARLEAASLRRTQAAQREFLSRLSHELRTPLTAIHGYASTLQQTDVDWDAASESRFLDVIVGESARMGRLVADLLDASTIEAGGLRLDRDWCDLGLAVEAAVRCVAGAGDVVSIDVHPDVRRAWVDHDRIEQVLVNLLDNAVRHGPPGGAITVTARATAGGTVTIAVTDQGPGFPSELRGRAFQAYARGDTAAPGAGLGLAVCQGIVAAHGGRIAVDDGAPHGSVTVVLPVEPPADVPGDLEVDEHAGL